MVLLQAYEVRVRGSGCSHGVECGLLGTPTWLSFQWRNDVYGIDIDSVSR